MRFSIVRMLLSNDRSLRILLLFYLLYHHRVIHGQGTYSWRNGACGRLESGLNLLYHTLNLKVKIEPTQKSVGCVSYFQISDVIDQHSLLFTRY